MNMLIKSLFILSAACYFVALIFVGSFFFGQHHKEVLNAAAWLLMSGSIGGLGHLIFTQRQYKEMRRIHHRIINQCNDVIDKTIDNIKDVTNV